MARYLIPPTSCSIHLRAVRLPSNDKRAKPASTKRASLPRIFSYSKQLLKDWERLSRSGRYDMGALKTAMLLLMANDAPLPPEYKDHELNGKWTITGSAI
ncbi:type II toxin-antitoxin system mRNA interferase toxin, RelE/StbE family [Rhizobium sp. CB3090]|uniref:type II toxin-antitoxin system mRNA interferase toxin, RelE/StbE family n=1 Tax=Rhizobium sp. CB3090 TaxID=3039156 RepID=UPI0024B13967|nr:type II toxin-antitoxin system mRNA interferase toxin, RelE/StbE family [Rhizobium sp. CB3090]WFU10914.1 type II toxin-antitoxin system mRNA interferase toxin, RelE/StbE family [Rhizobium sp. CB3090]